jgi:DNA-binding CsgD family transcriptional regulator/tetratricopeptide (TPR) repeat protein
MDVQPVLVGREPEREALRAVVERAASGQPSMLLLHGEAGIGKTSLVREAAGVAGDEGCHVLFGQCLRFGANVTSYVPFTQAFTLWLRTARSEYRDRLAPHGTVDDLVPALSDPSGGLALLQIGTAVDAIQSDGPTILVVDDLQWSDPSSLDALSYLVAGFVAGQRLAILSTYRDTDLDEGHRLHGWLADALRMPSVSRIALGRMDAWTMEEMVLARGGPSANAGLAGDVLRRSGGNPYLADLLIGEARSGGHSADSKGERLVDALSASWHRLSAPGRRVTQLLAVAGAPVAYQVLRDLAALHGVATEDTSRALGEAAAQGITIETESGAIWFRHPLLAETIAGSMRIHERAEVHSDLAARWCAAVGVDERDRANFLALHYLAAGESDQAFAWSLRAADEAAAIRARDEEATHLSTAVSLLERVSEGAVSTVDAVGLLIRAGRACEGAGDDHSAVRHYEAALTRVERSTRDPLLASRILLQLHVLRDRAGYGSTYLSTVEPREVLALTEGLPNCEERALAFAHLAFAEAFSGIDEAREHAETAVRLAERVDTPPALIWSFGARAQTKWGTEEGVPDAQRAFALASEQDDPQLFCWSAIFLSNSLESAGRYADAASITVSAYRTLRDAGEFDYAASVGAVAARWDFALGRWHQTRPMVRELLTISRSDDCAATSRCVAALMCAYEGRSDAALMHLRRAEELRPNASPVGDPLVDTQIQVSLALGDPMDSLERISKHMAAAVHVNPVAADEWLMYASQAAAQLAGRTGTSAERQVALRLLERIETTRGIDPPPFDPAGPRDVVHPAFGALHAAQRAQCDNAGTALDQLWEAACTSTRDAGLGYEHARALYCLAHHLLTHGHDRNRAAATLLASRRIAVDLGAVPLKNRVDALAAQAHLQLRTNGPAEPTTTRPSLVLNASPPLTPREREILDGLLSGETYAQIATRLFVSDKTVSSHVSNILRKTGSANRIELAELAHRTTNTEGV